MCCFLSVAGFPRSRGDIEEYRSRRVRMDGVVLVDFEEEALRRFLKSEVSSGAIRIGDIESELERYKQDIISVAEYYDEKDILTVVMGDQDTEEMIDDMVMAVDRIIETRKHIQDEDSQLDLTINHDCSDTGPCKSLIPSPNGMERPSTVEIREATEEDIKSIEAASRNSKEDIDGDDKASESSVPKEVSDVIKSNVSSTKDETESELSVTHEESESGKNDEIEGKQPTVPILFAFENIKSDCETLKDLVVNEIGMCFINFYELVRSDGDKNDRLDTNESLNLLQSVLQRDSVSYENGFFISGFPFDLLKESKFEKILKLGDISFVCKVREKSFETEVDETRKKEELLFESPMSEQVRIIFVTEKNIVEELKTSLQEIVIRKDPSVITNDKPSDAENGKEGILVQETSLEATGVLIHKEEVEVSTNEQDIKQNLSELEVASKIEREHDSGEIDKSPNDNVRVIEGNEEQINQGSVKDEDEMTSRDENEESTCQDVEDIITDNTLDEGTKPRGSLQSEETINDNEKEAEMEDTLSQVSEVGAVSIDVCKEKPILARQQNLDVETTSASESTTQLVKDPESEGENITNDNVDADDEAKIKLVRQETFVSTQGTIHESDEPQTDAKSNGEVNKADSDVSKNQEENIEEKLESKENGVDNQNSETVVEYKTSENEEEEPICTQTSQLQEENDSSHVEENKVNANELNENSITVSEETKSLTENSESNHEENEAIEAGEETEKESNVTVEVKSETSQLTENGESNREENEAIEAGEESEKNSNVTVVQDASADVDDHKDVVNSPESIKDETESEKCLSEKEENLEATSKSDNVDDIKEADVETSIQTEISDEIAGKNVETCSSDKKQEFSEEMKECNDTIATPENNSNGEDDENLKCTENTKEGKTSSDETSTDGDSENSQIEATKQEVASDKEDNAEENTISETKSVEIPDETETNEVTVTNNSESKDDISEKDSADEAHEENNNEQISDDALAKETDVVSDMSKGIDNDSDSNDEKSITIETKAEVHAPDSESPPLVQDLNTIEETEEVLETEVAQETDNDQETQDVHKATNVQEQNIQETDKINETQNIETQSIGETDDGQDLNSIEEKQSIEEIGILETQSIGDTDSVQESCNVTESHPAVVENENFIIVDTDAIEDENDLLDCDITSETCHTLEESIINKEIKSETTEESQVTTVQEMESLRNERFSGKIQERNGSGILGDSRHDDHSGLDEPQERSSSSSRGEL